MRRVVSQAELAKLLPMKTDQVGHVKLAKMHAPLLLQAVLSALTAGTMLPHCIASSIPQMASDGVESMSRYHRACCDSAFHSECYCSADGFRLHGTMHEGQAGAVAL